MAKKQLPTNEQLYQIVRKKDSSFESVTPSSVKEFLNLNGSSFRHQGQSDEVVFGQYFKGAFTWWLDTLETFVARDLFKENGFGVNKNHEFGGEIQKSIILASKSISPMFKNAKGMQAKTPDQFAYRPTENYVITAMENWDYQNFISSPDSSQLKNVFFNEHGLSEFLLALIEGLNAQYALEIYLVKQEVQSRALLNTENFKKKQNVSLSVSNMFDMTQEELKNVILTINNVVTGMTVNAFTDDYNELTNPQRIEKSQLVLVVRAPFKNQIRMNLLRDSMQADGIGIDIDFFEVDNFGGLEPFADESLSEPLNRVFDKFGSTLGFTKKSEDIFNGTEEDVDVFEGEAFWKDPHADVLGYIADKRILTHYSKSDLRMGQARNEAGLYTNYWISKVGDTVVWDNHYPFVILRTGKKD